MHSVTGLFCPELEHLYNTRELMDKGLEEAKDDLL